MMAEVRIPEDAEGMRLDRFLRKAVGSIGQGLLERQLRQGRIRLDGAKAKANTRLQAGQALSYPDHLLHTAGPSAPAAARPKIDQASACTQLAAMVVAEDDDWLAVNKPAGLAVQGGSGTTRHVDGLLRAAFPEKPPKLVHRLDKDTSGLLLLARHDKAARALTAGFADKTISKVYLALVIGDPGPDGRIEAPLRKAGGKGAEKMLVDHDTGQSAITDFLRLDKAGPVSLVALRPVTGRTHQLRVHMAAAGTPILGDGKYAGTSAHIGGFARQLHLHARFLSLADDTLLSAPVSEHLQASAELAGLADSLPDVMPFFGFHS